jgi:hypothetical protein
MYTSGIPRKNVGPENRKLPSEPKMGYLRPRDPAGGTFGQGKKHIPFNTQNFHFFFALSVLPVQKFENIFRDLPFFLGRS